MIASEKRQIKRRGLRHISLHPHRADDMQRVRSVLVLLFFLTTFCLAQSKSEDGALNGVRFRIDIPEHWNHGLVVYYHALDTKPELESDPNSPMIQPNHPIRPVFLNAGYAVAQSAHSAGGLAVAEAIPDTEALRQYFVGKYGQPKETYVSGGSYGGYLALATMEKHPKTYDGALVLCGTVPDLPWFAKRRFFDTRVVFDYYFPGILPSPAKVPPEYTINDADQQKIEKLLESSPEKATALRAFTAVRTNAELAAFMVLWTYALGDIERRSGGNPFDNRNTIYTGSPDDNALNNAAVRYSADPGAIAYLEQNYMLNGRLERPVLAIHTTYDPLIPTWAVDRYSVLTQEMRHGDLFTAQYVPHAGHCEITTDEVSGGFNELRRWVHTGQRPSAGRLNQNR
jgi:pimeloyl-ACP methyl ester carboxylesterase